ncbi:transcriptional regulator opi1 [Coemansia sp. RSA 1813]|nr:transcriptional regulator opi1 [Coemansia sp. RSA 1646]KAJ1764923.1 transcriptional regulator opi1 [Coemansia sp. RSA 1843]KAJ2086395.1 transcriptional regulator opi1 [Coemansia sp. RSA 986]KAJ2215672.1 transcriptional regulator opi1 [Coemansia sp. RSA 487]KAJ2568416.1 transcriptional regulator opi1 [Coemansia sp. RSA 1813]
MSNTDNYKHSGAALVAATRANGEPKQVARESTDDWHQRRTELYANSGASRVAISELVHHQNSDEESFAADHTMVEAAQALESLRGEDVQQQQQPLFIKRVQAIPLVNSALEIYGRSRESSKLLRVGSSVIESGVRRMCQPITKRIDVSQLDSFACRQLDNLGYTMEQQSQSEQPHSQAEQYQPVVRSASTNLRKRTKDQADRQQSPPPSSSMANNWVSMRNDSEYANGKNRDVADSRGGDIQRREITSSPSTGGGRGWIVGNFVASAKERAIAYREDSMRRLKYCLDWVVYAAALISQHMRDLRALLSSLQEAAHIVLSSGPASNNVTNNEEDGSAAVVHRDPQQQRQHELALRLAKARREIVGAVRKAVAIVSNYAGSVLPGEARRQVRSLILGMPGRWMAVDTAMSQSGGSSIGTPSVVSDTNSSPSSPALVGSDMAPANIEATTRRTLAFASESFQMLNGISGVFGHLYANAERWVGSTTSAVDPSASRQDQELPPADPFATYRDHATNGATASSDGVRLPPTVRRPQRRLPLNLTPIGNKEKAATGCEGEDVAGLAADTAAVAISRLSTTSLDEMMMDTGDIQTKRKSFPYQTQHQQPLFGSTSARPASTATSPMLRASGPTATTTTTTFRYSRYDDTITDDDSSDWVAHKRNRTREPTPTRM